ncbi:MAG TPA: hypothetical protein VGV39_12740 [Mesorhizobium sp.]|jgi:hypothetical protein|uniref:hypothetical protein n=1 Tax=Mesorhizobium sp. TaxID=1871066 RepID=UPI002DDD87C7|nr:hypothetical protein [Mesorhizobium sp.]HEV2503938.1 hypothetical protein [Mesorhizobium sp.]
MQVAPIGALEVALSNMSSGMALQQQMAVGSATQPGSGTNAADPKSQVLKAKKPEQGGVATGAGQQVAQDTPQTAASTKAQRQTLEPVEATSEHKLFEYLTQVEKSGGGQVSDTSALLGSAVKSLEGTMQKVQAALKEAGVQPDARPNDTHGGTGAAEAEEAVSPAQNAEQLLDRSISVMWAAANLEVVTSSVTAVTSSTSTLIKQQ